MLNLEKTRRQTETNEKSLRLLELATFNNLVLISTLDPHKPTRRWICHSPDGKHHNQIDYILVKKRFRSGFNIYRTRSFPRADIVSDSNLVLMTFLSSPEEREKSNPAKTEVRNREVKGPRYGMHV